MCDFGDKHINEWVTDSAVKNNSVKFLTRAEPGPKWRISQPTGNTAYRKLHPMLPMDSVHSEGLGGGLNPPDINNPKPETISLSGNLIL